MEHITYSANTAHIMILCASLGKAAEKDGMISIKNYAASRYIFYRDAASDQKMPWDEDN